MAVRSSGKKTYQTYGSAPYVRSRVTTGDLMYLVVLSLLPAAGVGMYHYGFHAALLIGISVGTAIAAELVCDLIHRSGSSIYDYSCVVTGLIGGLILPPAAPLWTAAVQSLLAIVLFKHAFGGLGRNLLNPAMAGHFVLTVLFYDLMSDYGTFQYTEEAPLTMLRNGETPDLVSMLTGNTAGCIGTSSAIAVLTAAVILLLSGVIDLYVPLSAAVSFVVLYAFFGDYGMSLYTQCVQLCGGSFLFTVIIMAGDYTTSPVSEKARVIYGALLGSFIFLFRELGFVEEACIASLLIVNAIRPLLDAKLAPHPFGANAARWVVRAPKKRRRTAYSAAQGYGDAKTSGAGGSAGTQAGRSLTNEALDEDFARFQEQIRRQTQGLETARYTGDDTLLREAMAEAGLEMDYTPTSGEFESVVTDTAAIRPEAIQAALEEEDAREERFYTRPLPPIPHPPTFGAPAQPPREMTQEGSFRSASDRSAYQPEETARFASAASSRRSGAMADTEGAERIRAASPDMYSGAPYPGLSGDPGQGQSPSQGPGQGESSSQGLVQGPSKSPGQGQSSSQGPVQGPSQDTVQGEEPVSRDTDILEVQEILRAEREMKRAKDEEFAGLDFIDLT